MKNLSYFIIILLISGSYFLKQSYNQKIDSLNLQIQSQEKLIEKLLISQTKNLHLKKNKLVIKENLTDFVGDNELLALFYFNSDNCWDCINQELEFLNEYSNGSVKTVLSFFQNQNLFNFNKRKYSNLNFVKLHDDPLKDRLNNKPAYILINNKNEVVHIFEPEFGQKHWSMNFINQLKKL